MMYQTVDGTLVRLDAIDMIDALPVTGIEALYWELCGCLRSGKMVVFASNFRTRTEALGWLDEQGALQRELGLQR